MSPIKPPWLNSSTFLQIEFFLITVSASVKHYHRLLVNCVRTPVDCLSETLSLTAHQLMRFKSESNQIDMDRVHFLFGV